LPRGDRFLVIGDPQIPFEASNALPFCLWVQKEFKIPRENVLCVGDEFDCYHGSSYPKSPDIDLTARQEIVKAREHALAWYKAFPKMLLADSNHGARWHLRAKQAGIPSEIVRDYRAIWEAPEGWRWATYWPVMTKHRFAVFHGLGYGAKRALEQSALDYGMNTVFGHHHSDGGCIHRIVTRTQNLWSMNAGCLIDVDSFAFDYEHHNRKKPSLGVSVVVDSGLTPIWVPYEAFK
jgi:hypothetical protein